MTKLALTGYVVVELPGRIARTMMADVKEDVDPVQPGTPIAAIGTTVNVDSRNIGRRHKEVQRPKRYREVSRPVEQTRRLRSSFMQLPTVPRPASLTKSRETSASEFSAIKMSRRPETKPPAAAIAEHPRHQPPDESDVTVFVV